MYNFSPITTSLDKLLDFTKQTLAKFRTGRASTQMLDSVKVEAYGSLMAINEVANINVVDNNLLVITPWDPTLLDAVSKGIQKAGLNLNPVVDKNLIRVAVPPLTQERRQELVKSLHQEIEAAKVKIRNSRHDYKNQIEDQKGQPGISEDDIKADVEELDRIIKDKITELDQLAKAKEEELLSV